MAKIQDYNFQTFYYLINQNKIILANCFDLGENLICSFKNDNVDDLVADVKIFENKLKSGTYTFKCKTGGNAAAEYAYNVTKHITYDEIDTAKPYSEKVQELDIEREIRRKIEFEKREEELEQRQKKIAEKEKMLNGFAGQGMQILEIVGIKLLEKYKPLFMPQQPEVQQEYEQDEEEYQSPINGLEREIDTLFTIEEQNKLVELLKNNQMYLDTVRNMIKN